MTVRTTWILRVVTLLVLLLLGFATAPRPWIPHEWRATLFSWFGAASYRQLPGARSYELPEAEELCPPDFPGWRG